MAHSHSRPMEVETINTHALISFRSIVAGLLVALFTMAGLLGLGLAFGGIGMDEDTSAKSAGIFTGVWFIATVVISLFIGSYFAARVSKFRTGRIGSAQGLVIASIFVGFFLYQTISAIGSIGSIAGSLIGKSGSALVSGAQKAAENPTITSSVSDMTEKALGDLNLRSDPKDVARGLGTRLVQGDAEGAKNYLAAEAGITPQEADIRIAQMRRQVAQTVDEAKEAAGTALKSTGWTLFLMVILGAIAGSTGGALGSVANLKNPLVINREERPLHGKLAY